MAELTLANADSTILGQIVTVLTAATYGEVAIFEAVLHVGSRKEAMQRYVTEYPSALIFYESTDEYITTDKQRGCVLNAEIVLITRAQTPTARKTAITQLVNLTRNALETTPPAASSDFTVGEGEDGYRRLSIERASIDADADQPWIMGFVPIHVGYVLTAKTSH